MQQLTYRRGGAELYQQGYIWAQMGNKLTDRDIQTAPDLLNSKAFRQGFNDFANNVTPEFYNVAPLAMFSLGVQRGKRRVSTSR